MAYAQEYWGEFTRGLIDYKVDIESDGFAGTPVEITNMKPDPVRIRRRGTRGERESVINGSELEFSFYSSIADANQFDVIFDSNYKDYRVSYYKDTVLQWRGWLRPENFVRDLLADQYEIKFSATDGLGDLKDIDFPTYNDEATILTNIKRAIAETDIELDFKVQLNTFENDLMSAGQCALNVTTINAKRFRSVQAGREIKDDCFKALTKMLAPFSCTLQQSGGKWWVIQSDEYNSTLFTYNYTTLAQTSASNDLRLDITNYDYKGFGDVERLEGIKSSEVTFRNENQGETLITNGTFDSATTGWTANNVTIASVSSEMRITLVAANLANNPYTQSNAMVVTSSSVNDKLIIRYKARLHDLVTAGSPEETGIYIESRLYDGTTLLQTKFHDIGAETTELTNFSDEFSIASSPVDDLYWRLQINANNNETDPTSLVIALDDVETQSIKSDSFAITFDKTYSVANASSTASKVNSKEIYFGDSFDGNDIGALKIGGTLTSSWKRFGKTEDYFIQNILGIRKLTDNKDFKNLLSVTVMDESDLLYPHYVYVISSKNYRVVTFEKQPESLEVKMKLEEILATDGSYTLLLYNLTTVDGQSTEVLSTQEVPVVSDHGQLSGLGNNDHPQYTRIATNETISGDWTFNSGGANSIVSVDNSTATSPSNLQQNASGGALVLRDNAGTASLVLRSYSNSDFPSTVTATDFIIP